jgi:hypothetical protein
MLIGKSFVVGAEKRRPAVELLLGIKLEYEADRFSLAVVR